MTTKNPETPAKKQSVKITKQKVETAKRKAANTKQKKKPTGVPSEYETKVKPHLEAIKRYVCCGVTEGQLCEFYNVGKTSWAKYKKDNPELNETLCNAKAELKTDLINLAYKTASGYWYEEIKIVTEKNKGGVVTGTKETKHKRYARPDAGMIEFLLINRFPSEYARDPQAIELRKKALELAERNGLSPNMEGI